MPRIVLLLIVASLMPTLPTTHDDTHASAPAAAVVRVTNAQELERALVRVRPGDIIQLADGTYEGKFVADRNGTRDAPITLQGSRRAVLDGGSIKGGYAFHLKADHWVLRGFTVTNAQKGIVADGANRNLLEGLRVYTIGDEAIHLRTASTHNTVLRCEIADTGKRKPGFGEGVYLGSARSNWKKYTDGQPDRSDGNRVIENRFGPNVRAEAIDIKEGTTGGEIRGNVFDGTGMVGKNSADSWVDVKGNGYLISDNRGAVTLRDGFQTHRILPGWGRDNRFRNNVADVQGSGYAVWIHLENKDASGNVVYDDNRATHAGGVANVPLTPVRR